MNLEDCRNKIIDFVVLNYVTDPEQEIPLDTSLVECGVLDSYGVIELVTYLETEFGIVIPNEDLTREKFGSVNKMATYVCGALEGSQVPVTRGVG